MGKPTLKRKSQSTLSSPPNKSALSQLQSLRELLGSTTFSEKDIYKCLQQSGYNVNIAAERLLCGFFKQSSNDSPILFNGSKSTSASPSFMGESSGRDNEHSSSKRPKPSSSCYSSTTSKTQSIKSNKSEFEVTNNDGTTKMQEENIKFDTLPNILFLCQKWIVGFSTSRFGSIKYQENIHIHTSSSDSTKNDGSNIVRFKGSRIEGTLDSNLSNMLSLLLRHEYICVECHGLLEDNQLHIGSEVPLQVNVYLRKPIDFFQLWDIASNNNVTDGDTSNIDNNILKKTITGKTKILPKNNNSKSSKNNKTDISDGLSNAAFDLLQWSQYDQLPTFRKPPNSDTGNTSKSLVTSPSTSNENNFSPSESKNNSIINADKASIIDDDDSKYEDVDNIDVYDESNSPEWAKSILDSNQTLPEEADPVMFTETGISLRSYQRQALYWMLQRERDEDGTSDGLKKQTELLSELLSRPSSTTNSSCVSLSDDESVVIDQRGQSPGPVKVTRTEALQSTTIQGKSNQIVHPLWQTRYLWDKSRNLLHSFYVNELMQTATCVPPNPPKQCVGGLLCDAMGLGKTVMLLSLIAKSKEIFDNELKEGLKLTNSTLVVTPLCLLSQWEEEIASKTTLTCSVYYGESSKKSVETHHKTDVVLTTYGMLLSHFKVNNTQTNFIFSHVWDRIILDEAHLIKNPQTIVSRACCSLQSKRRWCVTGTPIQNSIQDVYGLLKFLRHEPWCEASFWKNVVTNTMVNKSQPSYDGVQQVENAVDDSMNIAFDRVRRVLTPLMLRRTKDSVSSDGKPILVLPPVEASIVEVMLSPPERDFYNALLRKSQSMFDGIVQSGTVSKSYFAILSLIQRLRQACDHISLTVSSRVDSSYDAEDFKTDNDKSEKETCQSDMKVSGNKCNNLLDDKFINEWLQNIPRSEASSLFVKKTVESLSDMVQSKETEECPICLENIEMKNVAITPCGHMFCRLCLKNILQKNGPADKSSTKDFNTKKRDFVDGECPMCNKWIHSSKITLMSQSSGLSEIGKDNEEQMQEKPNAECNSLTPLRDTLDAALRGNSSSKMTAILLELEKIWDVDPGSKIIVFSQFLGFLDLLEKPLRKKGIVYFRLDGSMSLKERCDELNQFNNSDGVKIPTNKDQGTCHQGSVLLASMKACGVGINLVAASSVFLVDPWWNAAFEDQCINRIHRIGQKAKIVRVRKFIVPNSVESKILQIQAKKKSIESEILSSGMKSQRGFNANPTLDDFISIFRAE